MCVCGCLQVTATVVTLEDLTNTTLPGRANATVSVRPGLLGGDSLIATMPPATNTSVPGNQVVNLRTPGRAGFGMLIPSGLSAPDMVGNSGSGWWGPYAYYYAASERLEQPGPSVFINGDSAAPASISQQTQATLAATQHAARRAAASSAWSYDELLAYFSLFATRSPSGTLLTALQYFQGLIDT